MNRRTPEKKSSAAMSWRCVFESPFCLRGRLEPGLCDPLLAEASHRLYTRPGPLSQASYGHIIGSPKMYIGSTDMEEDHHYPITYDPGGQGMVLTNSTALPAR